MKRQKSVKADTSAKETTLFKEIRDLVISARQAVVRNVNALQVITNFEIGRRIVEQEQRGSARAEYGEKLLTHLSRKLTDEFGKGFSKTNLKLMRQFFLMYSSKIGQTQSDQSTQRLMVPSESLLVQKSQTASAQSVKSRTPSGQAKKVQTVSAQLVKPDLTEKFTLSWSHYVFLMGIKDENERSFYEIEAREQNWSLRELKRQYDASLYERLALSRDKNGIRALSKKGQVIEKSNDILKNPYVLEFLGLEEHEKYSESDLESAIIGKLEQFLLELGKGFLFQARQQRFTFDEDHYFVDLVFYNRLLRCYVLIDLKIGELTHQDLGQMQMYVNYFDRSVKTQDENPTIGIVLCKKKKEALVEITLPKDANIHAGEYKLYLPSKKELQRKLLDWVKDAEAER